MDWLSWAEYCYNTSFHTALRATPFEVAYGRSPPPILPYRPRMAWTKAADALLRTRDDVLAEVRQRLIQAQQLSKKYYDASHRDVEFEVGDCGYVSYIVQYSPWTPAPNTSWVHGMLGPFVCSSASAMSPTVFSFRGVLASTMSSTSVY